MAHNELIGSVSVIFYSAFMSDKSAYSPIKIVFKLFSHMETLLDNHMKNHLQLLVHDGHMENCSSYVKYKSQFKITEIITMAKFPSIWRSQTWKYLLNSETKILCVVGMYKFTAFYLGASCVYGNKYL